jgi:hypothetical protein
MAHAGMRQIGAAGDLRVVRVLSLEIRGFCSPIEAVEYGIPRGARLRREQRRAAAPPPFTRRSRRNTRVTRERRERDVVRTRINRGVRLVERDAVWRARSR